MSKIKMKRFHWLIVIVALSLISACKPEVEEPAVPQAETQAENPTVPKKKVLYVNSYDIRAGENWSIDVLKGVLSVFNIRMDAGLNLDDSASPVSFKIFNMKTKKNKTIENKEQAALEAKALIESWNPDVVICADDNASKYLIVPYFKDTAIPFVFCGVNWDASEYGFPCSNVTGMLEVFPVREALNILTPYAKGERIGFLSSDTLSEHKNGKYIRDIFHLDLVERYANNVAEFEQAYRELQKESDILMIIDTASLADFDVNKLFDITNRYASIPTVAFAQRQFDNYLLICDRVPQEQGEWAAGAALEILNGKSPEQIPIVMNKKAGIRLNMVIAKKLEVKFPMELIQRAIFVSEAAGK